MSLSSRPRSASRARRARPAVPGLSVGILLALIPLATAATEPAHAQDAREPSGRGFTISVGVGAGATTLERPAAEDLRESVVGSFDLRLGRFVRETIAIGVGFTVWTWSTQDAITVSDFNTYEFGLRGQWWVHPRWAIGLGIGALEIDDTDRDVVGRSGAAVTASLSHTLVHEEGQAHLLTLRWLEGRVDEEAVDGGDDLDHRVLTLLYRWQAW